MVEVTAPPDKVRMYLTKQNPWALHFSFLRDGERVGGTMYLSTADAVRAKIALLKQNRTAAEKFQYAVYHASQSVTK